MRVIPISYLQQRLVAPAPPPPAGDVAYLGGLFTSFNGVTNNRIIALNDDGTVYSAFSVGTGIGNGGVLSIDALSDGRIVCCGNFTSVNGTTLNRIVMFNADGTEDTTFRTNVGTAFNNTCEFVGVTASDQIYVGGSFTTFNGNSRNRILRLNSDGTEDSAFYSTLGTAGGGTIYNIITQTDGKLVIGGSFITFNGVSNTGLIRLNTDGTEDTTFRTNQGTGFNTPSLKRPALQSDGKVLVGGSFTTFDGNTVNRIVRLNSDGTEDTGFTTNTGTGFNGNVNGIQLMSSGQFFMAGAFTTFNGTTRDRIIRLNSDGTDDTSFNNNLLSTTGGTGNFNNVVILNNGKFIVFGGVTVYGGVTVNRIILLNSDGTVDTSFTTNTGTGANNTILSGRLK